MPLIHATQTRCDTKPRRRYAELEVERRALFFLYIAVLFSTYTPCLTWIPFDSRFRKTRGHRCEATCQVCHPSSSFVPWFIPALHHRKNYSIIFACNLALHPLQSNMFKCSIAYDQHRSCGAHPLLFEHDVPRPSKRPQSSNTCFLNMVLHHEVCRLEHSWTQPYCRSSSILGTRHEPTSTEFDHMRIYSFHWPRYRSVCHSTNCRKPSGVWLDAKWQRAKVHLAVAHIREPGGHREKHIAQALSLRHHGNVLP